MDKHPTRNLVLLSVGTWILIVHLQSRASCRFSRLLLEDGMVFLTHRQHSTGSVKWYVTRTRAECERGGT